MNTTDNAVRFRYRPPLGRIVLGAAFSGACAIVMAHWALHNDRGLIINGILRLGVQGASTFYWLLCILSVGLMLSLVFYLLPQAFVERQIVLEEDAITLPARGFSARHFRVPYRELHDIVITTMNGTTFLKIRHAGGTSPINPTWLPRKEDVHVILEVIRRQRDGV